MRSNKFFLLVAVQLLLVSTPALSAPSRLSAATEIGQTDVDAAATSSGDAIFKRMEHRRVGRPRRNDAAGGGAVNTIPVRMVWSPEQALQGIAALDPMATVNFVFETEFEQRAIAFVASMNARLAALAVPPRHSIKVYYKVYHRTNFRAIVEATAQVSAT